MILPSGTLQWVFLYFRCFLIIYFIDKAYLCCSTELSFVSLIFDHLIKPYIKGCRKQPLQKFQYKANYIN